MKNLIFTLLIIFLLGFSQASYTQVDSTNALLEYCTGTWCGYCPCGHQIIQSILQSYPKTVVIAYHGASTDPWISYSAPMISMFGFNAYPTGVVSRSTGIISRSAWFGYVSVFSASAPAARIQVNNKTYNAATRTVTASVVVTALQNMDAGSYYINFILTEGHIVYPQTSYSSCGYNGVISDYVHEHVNKGLINGATGTLVTDQTWNQNTSFTIPLNYVIPAGVVDINSNINVFVYKSGSPVSSSAPIQNATEHTVPSFTPTGIIESGITTTDYVLEQNYPNPFNPTTNIRFNVPKAGNATFKIYDINGKEVAKYLEGRIEAGVYKVEFNGADLPSGVYFYRLTIGNFTDTKKMVLTK
jgi:hypothetical protein